MKRAVQFVSDFENRVTEHAQAIGCDGVVCGHIHVPCLRTEARESQETMYVNLGDWVENSTALIEYSSGRLELMDVGRRLILGESLPRPIPSDSDSQHNKDSSETVIISELDPCPIGG